MDSDSNEVRRESDDFVDVPGISRRPSSTQCASGFNKAILERGWVTGSQSMGMSKTLEW